MAESPTLTSHSVVWCWMVRYAKCCSKEVASLEWWQPSNEVKEWVSEWWSGVKCQVSPKSAQSPKGRRVWGIGELVVQQTKSQLQVNLLMEQRPKSSALHNHALTSDYAGTIAKWQFNAVLMDRPGVHMMMYFWYAYEPPLLWGEDQKCWIALPFSCRSYYVNLTRPSKSTIRLIIFGRNKTSKWTTLNKPC
jgi:hypothetical protein